MAIDHIRYDILAQDALRGVVRRVLMDAAKNGLPGEHHFYISFDTRAEGVRLSPRMRAQYPEERAPEPHLASPAQPRQFRPMATVSVLVKSAFGRSFRSGSPLTM